MHYAIVFKTGNQPVGVAGVQVGKVSADGVEWRGHGHEQNPVSERCPELRRATGLQQETMALYT
ncbi:hypothetical protein ACINB_42700 [Acidovorax sp. NB1]|nr:hypothetical protein ACINB_42700 [Acidovorax sp. NB1]